MCLTYFCLTYFCLFRYAQAAKIVARIFSPYLRKCWRSAVREGPDRQGAGGLGKGSPGLQTRALRHVTAFGFGRFGRSSNPAGTRWPGAGRLAGDIGAISCETQAGSIARFFAGSEPRFFSEPGFWSRRDGLRRPDQRCRFGSSCVFGRSGRIGRFGGSCDFAGLAGSVECGTNRGHPRNRRPPMPKPHARATRAISPRPPADDACGCWHVLARNDLHWLNDTRRSGTAHAASVDRDRQDQAPQYRDPA